MIANSNKITLEVPVSEQHLGMICSELLKLATQADLAKEAMQELKLFINALIRDEDYNSEQHKLFDQVIDDYLDEFIAKQQEASKATESSSEQSESGSALTHSHAKSEHFSSVAQAHLQGYPIAVEPPTRHYLANKANTKFEYVEPKDPEKAVCMLAKGDSYLRYQTMFSRLLFSENMTDYEKDSAILDLSLLILEREMNKISQRTNRSFVNADYLYFINSREQQY